MSGLVMVMYLTSETIEFGVAEATQTLDAEIEKVLAGYENAANN